MTGLPPVKSHEPALNTAAAILRTLAGIAVFALSCFIIYIQHGTKPPAPFTMTDLYMHGLLFFVAGYLCVQGQTMQLVTLLVSRLPKLSLAAAKAEAPDPPAPRPSSDTGEGPIL